MKQNPKSNDSNPVVQLQARHLGKLAGVVGDQQGLLAQGVDGNHGVRRADGCACHGAPGQPDAGAVLNCRRLEID